MADINLADQFVEDYNALMLQLDACRDNAESDAKVRDLENELATTRSELACVRGKSLWRRMPVSRLLRRSCRKSQSLSRH